ncbi:MAG: 1,4-dihydroxy-2-naphthoate polyprenyltransferase [Desulfobacterales bacterium]|jgi:1,4-dihydroxy-2-naphthoate octaprenyltransferase
MFYFKYMTNKDTDDKSKMGAWMLAARPRTLPAAVAPVLVGTAMAIADKHFAWLPAAAALTVALLLQIGVNLANDYFDYIKGIDTRDRLGPPRVTQSGLIPAKQVKTGMLIAIILSVVPGLYLASVGGWPIILIGLSCFAAALAYSGGPFPLASHGLGDLFVFIFFGLVAVGGTYYVQALQITPMVWLMGAIQGLLITAILVVNNLRDIQTDRRSGKRTLAVRIGEQGSRIEYLLLLCTAYAIPFILWLSGRSSVWVLMPVFSLPLAISLTRRIWKSAGGPALNQALANTAKLTLVYSMLLSIGLILSFG